MVYPYCKIFIDLLSIFLPKSYEGEHIWEKLGGTLASQFISFQPSLKTTYKITVKYILKLYFNDVPSWWTLYDGIISNGTPPHFGVNDV